jgi:hypothetical protein
MGPIGADLFEALADFPGAAQFLLLALQVAARSCPRPTA